MAAKKRILASEDVPPIISLMAAHKSSAGVQQAGCETLAILVMGEKNQIAIPANGGIEVLVKAMGAHESSAGVQKAG